METRWEKEELDKEMVCPKRGRAYLFPQSRSKSLKSSNSFKAELSLKENLPRGSIHFTQDVAFNARSGPKRIPYILEIELDPESAAKSRRSIYAIGSQSADIVQEWKEAIIQVCNFAFFRCVYLPVIGCCRVIPSPQTTKYQY